jgi:hypothetical protein
VYQYPDSGTPAASGGTFLVGFAAQGNQPVRPQFIANHEANNCLVIENRYGGPLGVQWATSAQQVGTGLTGQALAPFFHVPRLRRVVMPWPKEYGFNVLYRSQYAGATLFDAANTTEAIPNFWAYQQTAVRYWWVTMDSPQWYSETLYPTEDRIILSRSLQPLVQGNKILHHVLPPAQMASFPFSAFSLLITSADNPITPPPAQTQDARIMRFSCAARGGTSTVLLTDLEATPIQIVSNGAASIRPFGSTAACTTEHQPIPWIDIPGSLGVVWDIDTAPGASQIVADVWYEVAIPLD